LAFLQRQATCGEAGRRRPAAALLLSLLYTGVVFVLVRIQDNIVERIRIC
jgi:hypothetical protein